jgi:hypothetical protein
MLRVLTDLILCVALNLGKCDEKDDRSAPRLPHRQLMLWIHAKRPEKRNVESLGKVKCALKSFLEDDF